MKITVERIGAQGIPPPTITPPPLDASEKPSFPHKPPRRKAKNPGVGVRLRREFGCASAKRGGSRPETPLLRWKFDVGRGKNDYMEENFSGEVGRRSGQKSRQMVSVRKLAAGLWRMRLPESQINVGERVGIQAGRSRSGASIQCHLNRGNSSPAKDLASSPHSVSGPRHWALSKFETLFQCPNSAMEGVTKWDPDGWKASSGSKQIFAQPNPVNHQSSAVIVISTLQSELDQAKARINELEAERKSSKRKLEQFLHKLTEERSAWRSREHDKVRAVLDDMKANISREKKNRQRLEIVNSKLVNELADVKLSAKRYIQEYEKERKARELIEEVCDELAKEIGEDKAEVEALKRESMKVREEVEEERRMLQMAEVWREERVQMKLVDAKVMLEEKYSQMNRLIVDLESLMIKTPDLGEMKKAQFLRQLVESVNMQDIRDLKYEPPNPDDIFSVFEDVNFGESLEREAEPSVGYSPASHASKIHTVSPQGRKFNEDGAQRHSNGYADDSGDLEDDASEWETVSHPEEQGSSYSPYGSDPAVGKDFHVSNASKTGAEWEENGDGEMPIMEISELDPEKARQLKKGLSVTKLWRTYPKNGDSYKIISVDAKNGRLSNGGLSNGTIYSTDNGSAKGCVSPQDLAGQWSSPESGNPHINRAKGCIEWPRSSQKSSLKARLLEARMESQKIQLRQVLKQKI